MSNGSLEGVSLHMVLLCQNNTDEKHGNRENAGNFIFIGESDQSPKKKKKKKLQNLKILKRIFDQH